MPFRAYIPQEEVIKYRKDQKTGGRLIYKVNVCVCVLECDGEVGGLTFQFIFRKTPEKKHLLLN